MMSVALHLSEFPVRLRFDEPFTDEQLIAFSRQNEPRRIEREANGELTILSPTGTDGSEQESDVPGDLLIWARQDGCGRAFNSNAEFKMADGSVRAPDAAWMRWKRLGSASGTDRTGCARLCPEFAIKVGSESDRLKTLQEMAMWTANGAELARLIDPVREVMEMYRPGTEPEVHEQPSVQRTGPAAGIELVMQGIWG